MSSSKHITWESWEEVDPDYCNGYSFFRRGVDRKGKEYEDWDDGRRARTPRADVGVQHITQHLDDTSITDDYVDDDYSLHAREEHRNKGLLQSEEPLSSSSKGHGYKGKSQENIERFEHGHGHKGKSQESIERFEQGPFQTHYTDAVHEHFDAEDPEVAEGDFDSKKRKGKKGKSKAQSDSFQSNEFEEQREEDPYDRQYTESGYVDQENFQQDTAGRSATKEAYPPRKHKSKGSERPDRHRSGSKETSRAKPTSSSRSSQSSKHTSRGASDKRGKPTSKSRGDDQGHEDEIEPFYSKPNTIPEEEDEETHASTDYNQAEIDLNATQDAPLEQEGAGYGPQNYGRSQRSGGSAYDAADDGFDAAGVADRADWGDPSYTDPRLPAHRHRGKAPPRQTAQQVPEYRNEYDDEEDEEFRAAIAEDPYKYSQPGPSTAATYDAPDDDGTTTPTPMGSRGRNIIAANPIYTGDYEQLDPRYVIEHSQRFQVGEVFKVLWSEPKGQHKSPKNRDTIRSLTEMKELNDEEGTPFFVGFRRFIVIATDEGHSTCVPILTYEKKGCLKRGVKAAKHGIVHAENRIPKPLSGEPQLGFSPVRMRLLVNDEKLAKESRVNYSKLVTVEHNVKVFFIGRIHPQDINTVSDAVDKCWFDKRRRPKGR